MEFHEVANIFPLLEGEEYRVLRDDIAANGLVESIWTYQGKIIDGRNRYIACLDLGIEPRYREWDGSGSLVAFVVSLNLHRRHLSSSQRAMVALAVEQRLSVEAKENLSTKTDQGYQRIDNPIYALEDAARITGTNRQYVSDAKQISQKAPDLADQVRSGELTIPRAKSELRRREREELRADPIPVPDGKYQTIVIDPPWPIEKIEREVRPNQYALDYETMSIEEIHDFNIPAGVADDDCHLLMWTTQKFLPHAFDILVSWGFRYVFTMVWHKPGGFQPYSLPQYNSEFVVYGRKGSPEFLETKQFFTCFNAPRNGHSSKPDEFYDLIRRVCPGPRIDIFNRRQIQGFDGWGNEVQDDKLEKRQGMVRPLFAGD